MHVNEPPKEYVPWGHCSQLLVDAFPMYPAGHDPTQAVPMTFEYLPGEQGKQEVLLGDVYVPGLHK